ncbi:WD40 repeat-like protein [Phlegmacium glaucopus]|nr:WD40 repeat-like protein [Phlegmacium glaucopus]
MPPKPSSYVCDTIPAARLAISSSDPQPMSFEPVAVLDNAESFTSTTKSPPRKLCVRHQRMADEGTNLKLQQSLDALSLEEREAVNAIWSNFSSSSHPRRALILQGLLTMCCFSQLSLLTEQLAHLIRIDPFVVLPREVALRILGYLDATSLCRAAQVTRRWRCLADDNILWRGICEQHIGQKCHKCGWGLPILERRRACRPKSTSPSPSPLPISPSLSTLESTSSTSLKRNVQDSSDILSPPTKRQRSEGCLPEIPSVVCDTTSPSTSNPSVDANSLPSSLLAPHPSLPQIPSVTRPWKDVYSERMTIERNWRRGRYTVRTFKGHTDGVMCLQFSETLSHPAFPVLITGSYDRTIRVWNLETGVELHCLRGHTGTVRALQFDEVKLITGSMDSTLKVWDWRRGKCIKTLNGHTGGVVCLNFDSNVLASGGVDSTIKVWNLRTGGVFTLHGHSDWVNAVQLWDSNPETRASSADSFIFDVAGSASPMSGSGCASSQIDPGKMLFSASDDGTIKLWDLNVRTCVRQFTGHLGQVQTMKLLFVEEYEETAADAVEPVPDEPTLESRDKGHLIPKRKKPILISGSLDNTIKLWDIDTAKAVQTYFGHIEGVWGVASDKMRLVSGSHDRTIKVWSRENGSCTSTLVGHEAAVSCLALGEDKLVSGSDDSTVKIWSFGG